MRTPSRRSSSNRPRWPNCSSKKFRTLTTLAERPYDIPILASRIVRYPSFTYPGTGGRRKGGGGEAVVKQPNWTIVEVRVLAYLTNDLLGNMSLIWAHKARQLNLLSISTTFLTPLDIILLFLSVITLWISVWGGKKENKFVYALEPIKKSSLYHLIPPLLR